MVSYARLRDGGHDLHVVSGSQSPDPKNLVTSAMAGFHRMCPSCAQTLYNEEVADGFGSGAEEGYARAPNLAYQAAAPAPSYGGGFPAQSYAAMQPQGLQGLQGYRMQPQQVGSPLTKTCPALLTRQRPAIDVTRGCNLRWLWSRPACQWSFWEDRCWLRCGDCTLTSHPPWRLTLCDLNQMMQGRLAVVSLGGAEIGRAGVLHSSKAHHYGG